MRARRACESDLQHHVFRLGLGGVYHQSPVCACDQQCFIVMKVQSSSDAIRDRRLLCFITYVHACIL